MMSYAELQVQISLHADELVVSYISLFSQYVGVKKCLSLSSKCQMFGAQGKVGVDDVCKRLKLHSELSVLKQWEFLCSLWGLEGQEQERQIKRDWLGE